MKILTLDILAYELEVAHAEKVAAAERQKQQLRQYMAGPNAAAIRAKHRAAWLEKQKSEKSIRPARPRKVTTNEGEK